MGLSNWPTVTDDDGSYATGTVFNKALTDAILASIEADLFSAANPSITAENIIDEVVTARGSLGALDTRLDVAINEDGTLKAQAGQATVSEVQGIVGQGNWVANENFLIWPGATAEAPAYWTLDTIAIAREASTVKIAGQSAKLTRSGSDGDLVQNLMNTTSFSANGAYYQGKTFAFGAWVKTSVASSVRLQFDDGVTTSETSYHTGTGGGGGNWEWLATTHTVSASATKMALGIQQLNSNGDAYVNGVTATVSENGLEITEWIPSRGVIGTIVFKRAGDAVAEQPTNKDTFGGTRPFIVLDTRLSADTAPTDATLIVDINTWNGSSFVTMYSTKPSILTTAKKSVVAKPDVDAHLQCFDAAFGTNLTDAELNWDIDQIGSSVPGADLMVYIRAFQYVRPQEALLDLEDV